MRKSIKGLSAILMTSVLAVSASAAAVTSFAADPTYTITMQSTTGHTYNAFQIFKGDVTKNGEKKVLSNIDWGEDVNSDALVDALTKDTTYGAAFTTAIGSETNAKKVAEKVAKQIATYEKDSAEIKAIAQIIGKNTKGTGTATDGGSFAGGYYLIKDSTSSLPTDPTTQKSDTISSFLLEVVGNSTPSAKDSTVESHKTVTETDDTTPTTTPGQKFADYDIGDEIPYELTFTLPSNYADYVNYPITFTDDMCAGLSWDGNAKIYYGASDTTGADIKFSSGDSSYPDGAKWTYTTVDLKTKTLSASDVITVKYSATLDSDAAINKAGNPNKYHVTFYRDPNNSTTPTPPTNPDEPTPPTPPTGDTPDDTTVVFTYELVFNKTDGKDPLKGADFRLEKNIGGTWTEVTAIHTGTGAKNPTKSAVTADTTQFTFSGLDAGEYKLTETATPSGYNSIDPIEFTVTRTAEGNMVTNLASTGLTMTPTFNATDAKLEAEIINSEGIELPGTGGIGTTIFYIVGSLMVGGALVLFVVRKRMNIKEQ